MPLDQRHLAQVRALIATLDEDRSAAHAIVALEDAAVACYVALQMGLTTAQLKADADTVLAEVQHGRGGPLDPSVAS